MINIFQSTPSWRGRRFAIGSFLDNGNISIHALVKRATIASLRLLSLPQYFNPRPREEGDEKKPLKDVTQAISIHALVKRATQSNRILKTLQPLFQSTPSWRGRQYTQ